MFVFGGGIRVDYLITQDNEAHNGLIGGNALYSAVGAALWSDDVVLWARAGQNYPRAWFNQLSDHSIQTKYVRKVEGQHDHRTFYAYLPDGRRDDTRPDLHYHRIGQPLPQALKDYEHSTPGQDDPASYEPLALRPDDWPDSLDRVRAIHLAPLSLRTHRKIPHHVKRRGIRLVTVDPGERYMKPNLLPYIKEVLTQIEAFLPSDAEVRSLFGDGVVLEEAAQELASWGPGIVVIKCGAAGVIVYERKQQRLRHLTPWHLSGDERIKDVTGAGDAFCGGFLVGLENDGDVLSAVVRGLVSSSIVIEGYGAPYALKQDKALAEQRYCKMFADVSAR